LYKLKFGKRAWKEWRALDTSVQRQFQKKLDKVLRSPHVLSMRLHGFPNCYRIKLRKAGMRLGYKVVDDQLLVMVIAVGPRDKDEIYEDFTARYNEGF
jgi:mRNA interferase RelE/StbE